MKKQIKILSNQEMVDKYTEYYFKKYPKRKVLKLSPTALSLNQYNSMVRIVQGAEKIKYNEYCLYMLEYYGIERLKLNNCDVKINFIWHDRRRRDHENYSIVSKFFNDAFVEYGLLEDDSYKQINSVLTTMQYIKGKHPSVEFIFEYDDELQNINPTQ